MNPSRFMPGLQPLGGHTPITPVNENGAVFHRPTAPRPDQPILKKVGNFIARFKSPASFSLPCMNACMALVFPKITSL